MKMTAQDLTEVIKSKDEGKEIEVRSLDGSKWFRVHGSTINLDREYRVKPEPEQPTEKLTAYVLVRDGRLVGGAAKLEHAIEKLQQFNRNTRFGAAKLVAVREI